MVTIRQAMESKKLFAPWFRGSTWKAWGVFLSALFGLELTEDELEIYRKHTGRTEAPKQAAREGWLVVGRRGGKSLISALVAVYLAVFRDWSAKLAPGERGTLMVIAQDRKQARVVLRYIRAFLEIPALASMIETQTQESIDLSNRVTIEIHTTSFRSTRGYSVIAVVADEIAFWRSDESANPDREILKALRPGMSTTGGMLLAISSPYARKGALWEAYQKHYGKDGPVLVWQADTASMNPAVDPEVIQQAYEDDESSAAAEYGALFRRDIESYVNRESVDVVVVPGRQQIPPMIDCSYFAFVDPSGGSVDSMTLAIAHRERRSMGDGHFADVAVLDLVREVKPPFSPDEVAASFADDCKAYRVREVSGDKYAGEWPRERFRVHGVTYRTADNTKSEIYQDLLPLINSGRVELLDSKRMINQLLSLERRTARSGKDSVDHPPAGHDDLINAAAGALTLAGRRGNRAQAIPLTYVF